MKSVKQVKKYFRRRINLSSILTLSLLQNLQTFKFFDFVQTCLGAVTEVDNGTRGTYYFDAFESRESGYIGPVAALPGNSVALVLPADSFLVSISYWLLSLMQEIWESVVNFFQPGDALARGVQVDAAQALPVNMLEESIPTGQVWKTYYYAGSQCVAMRVNDGETDEVYYLFSDHLGSTSITNDSEGNWYGEMRYTAWGEVRYSSGQTPTDYTYTGQRSEMSSFGLIYYNARWYEPALGRFAEGDSFLLEPSNILDYDRYTYTRNNPIKYVDPTGYFSEEEIISFFGVENWEQVLAMFDNGGQLEGRWGWLEVLQIAEYGDEITIKWDDSQLIDEHVKVSNSFSGTFDSNIDGKLIITGEDIFLDQMKAAKYGVTYELTHYEMDLGKILGGGIIIVATDLGIGLPAFAAIPLSGFNPPVIKAVEALETFVVLPLNILGISLIREGIDSDPIIYKIPAVME